MMYWSIRRPDGCWRGTDIREGRKAFRFRYSSKEAAQGSPCFLKGDVIVRVLGIQTLKVFVYDEIVRSRWARDGFVLADLGIQE